MDLRRPGGNRNGGGHGESEIQNAGARAAQDYRQRAPGHPGLPGQTQLQVRSLGLEQIHGGCEAARSRNYRSDAQGKDLHRARVAELANLCAGLNRHARRNEQVQNGLPKGDGLNLRAITGFRSTGAARYSGAQFFGDCSGGVIAALIALPYGLAMASLMGLPPVLGVFTSILTAPVIALLGRNPVLIGGTASATVPFIALAVRQQGVMGAAKICIAAAVFMLLFSMLRLGRYIHKVPQAVVTGFSCGIGGLMLISQLDIILVVDSPATRLSGSTAAQFL